MTPNKINRYFVFSFDRPTNRLGWESFNFSVPNLSDCLFPSNFSQIIEYDEVQIIDVYEGVIIFEDKTDNFEANYKLFYEKYGVNQLLRSSVE